MRPYGLYIHIPSCNTKCSYCDFVSMPMESYLIDRYIDGLLCELTQSCKALTVDTVFVGGGNPTSLSGKQIKRVLTAAKGLSGKATEFSVESNPNSLTRYKLDVILNSGVNRVSLGLQTHDDAILSGIGRRHTYKDYETAVKYLTDGKISNINVDIMMGLPRQNADSLKETVERVADSGVTHVSAYSLKVEQGTSLYKSGYRPDADLQADMYQMTCELLSAKGYRRYEISNFCKPGYECRHNLKYWKAEPYIGCGLSAASLLGNNTRITNTHNLDDYLSGDIIADKTAIGARQARTEYIMLGLRLTRGILLSDYQNRFGQDLLIDKQAAIDKLTKLGLVAIQDGRLKIPDDKLYISNGIIAELI